MPTIKLQGTEVGYQESDVITFTEGLIGMPQLRKMVLVRQPEMAPFLWLVPVDTDEVAFVVVDPRELFADYAPRIAEDVADRFPFLIGAEQPLLLSVVVVRREWAGTTVNLRAPLVVSPHSMQGAQIPLVETAYRVDEPLPVADAA